MELKKIPIIQRLPEDENEEVLVFWQGVTGLNATTANCEQHKDKARWYDYRGQEINTSNYKLTHWSKIK